MEEVVAKTIIKSPLKSSADVEDKFRIPKHYKRVFATGLAIKSDTPQVLRELAINIESIFQIGITKDNYVNFFHHLLWYEETIIRINLKKYNMTGVVLVNTESDCLGFFVPGLGEKRPSLLLGDFLFVKPQKTDMMFEAVITEINENHVYIRGLDSRFWKHYSHAARFDIRFFPSRLALERMHHAVHSVLSGGLAARVFPVKNKKPVKLVQIKRFYNAGVAANPEQRLAVERIVSGASGAAPYLLHGPPGTGKTVTVVEAILQLVTQNSQNRIMVCTDSNMAADHVATMLIQYTSLFPDCLLLRANSKYRVWETLPECLHPYSNGSNVKNFQRVSVTDFLSYRIVVITLSHSAMFARQFHSRQRPITHLFIDEAGQASEPACLIPSAGLLRAGGALVLAGDPLQLGPVVISHAARARGLGESLMERLKNKCPLYNQMRSDPNYMVMLLNNFRSHSDILHIPNELFYKGQLRALAPEDPISRKDILGDNSESRAIIFHGVLSREQKMGKSPSFYNSMELEILQMYVKVLIENHDVKPEDIGIVAPYIRQVYKMKFWLKAQNLSTVEVGTVEAFQGKEKRVILISTVRANCGLLDHDALYQLGFLVDDKRFNVALTRAKAKAIIIGNPLCLEKDVKWLTYMEQCRRLGTYVGFESADRGARTTQQELLSRLAPMLSDLTTRAKDKNKKDIDGKGKDKKDKDRKDKDKDRKDKAKDRKDKGKKDKDIKDKDKKMKT